MSKVRQKIGLLGRKMGMTQVFTAQGDRLGVTVIELGPCKVIDIKHQERDGYWSVQLGYQEKKEKNASRAEAGHAKKAGNGIARFLREFRVTEEVAKQYQVGQVIDLKDIFNEGDFIDVSAKTKGRGFQGVIKRWGFHGFPASHGTHEFFRHGGSIGNREFPGRVFKNRKMAGQYGNELVTIQNVKIVKIVPEKNFILIHGAVPGAPEAMLTVRHAVKKAI